MLKNVFAKQNSMLFHTQEDACACVSAISMYYPKLAAEKWAHCIGIWEGCGGEAS